MEGEEIGKYGEREKEGGFYEDKRTFQILTKRKRKRAGLMIYKRDGEGEDFSFSDSEGGVATDSIPGHIVWRCRSNRVQYYSAACCINRRLSLQQPIRHDDPADRGWSRQSGAVLRWVPHAWPRLEMNSMALGVRKRRHCERGERGQTVPRMKLPFRLLCIVTVACACARAHIWLLSDSRCCQANDKQKMQRMICGRDVKQAGCDVKMGSLFPWFQ